MQKFRAQKPFYKDGNVISKGADFETTQSHGRDLVKKGYAVQVGGESAEVDAGVESGGTVDADPVNGSPASRTARKTPSKKSKR